ncbi:MAG: SpoIIE family protein phosphatase [Bacteroidota bacterium]|nr:SpoIIE family protein phosphatase [Bacteroidota bacterium]
MRRTGYICILISLIGLGCSLLFEPNNQGKFNFFYFLISFSSIGLFFLGISFLMFPLPLERRRKFATGLFILTVFLLALYYFFKEHRFPGAAFLAFGIFYVFSFLFLPLHSKNRIEKWKAYTGTWYAYFLTICDLVSLASIFCGILFRVMHWPFGEALINFGIFVLAITLISWNRLFGKEIVLRKAAEDKVKDSFTELKKQHIIIEEKNKEILDSITYAKRLQDAILPSDKIWYNYLANSFVLYQPKDIVAGDFYWIEKISQKSADLSKQSDGELPTADLILFAAADCTGHGVPGAMVSVVCSNALNRTVKEFNITEPGKILDKVRELVIETFEKSESEVKDGMDISLCALNVKTNELKWAGANNPLWYILGGGGLQEIKADKQPIGKYADEKPFTTHTLQLNKGDILYIFTDGYADQFGGPKGKKFKYKQLLQLLIDSHNKEMPEQKKMLDTAFKNWKAGIDQVDDVCIIGIKI